MKAQNRERLNARAESALRAMYHNATIDYPRDTCGRSDDYFQSWLEDQCANEFDYLQHGGAYGDNYRATLAAPCNAGKYKSPAAQRRYIDKGMRDMAAERADCGMLTGWRMLELAAGNSKLRKMLHGHLAHNGGRELTRNNSLWERATEYGDIVQYGRGGRTLAPSQFLRHTGGGGYCILADAGEEMSAAAVVELIQIIESFNRYIGAWCAGVPEMWREHCAEEDREAHYAKVRASVRKGKETRERNYWAARDSVTV